jgi:hypothetical protein
VTYTTGTAARPGKFAQYRKAVAAAVAAGVAAAASLAVALLPVLQGDAQRYALVVIALAAALGVPVAVAKSPRNAYPWNTAREIITAADELGIPVLNPNKISSPDLEPDEPPAVP